MSSTGYRRRPTALLRVSSVALPPLIVTKLGLQVGQTFYISVPSRDSIRFSRDSTGHSVVRRFDVLDRTQLLIGRDVLNLTDLRAGDVVQFDLAEAGGILVMKRIAIQDDPDFTDPEHGADGLPIPPGWLCQSFTSSPDANLFVNGGRKAAEMITEWLHQYDAFTNDPSTILDFGSGCGRVLQHMNRIDPGRIHNLLGCDLHEQAIDWASRNLAQQYFMGTLHPPLPLQSSSMDTLYAISVFTHLDEYIQQEWLAEWARVVRKGGVVILTFNGDDFVEKHLGHAVTYQDQVRKSFQERSGFAFMKDGGWDGVFVEDYQTTYQTFAYIRQRWVEHFEILDIKPSGAFANRQNSAILRRR